MRQGPFRLLVKAADVPREVHDRASMLLHAAFAEAGYPTRAVWIGDRYKTDPPVPDDVLWKARRLVCDRLGLPYEELDEDDVGGAA